VTSSTRLVIEEEVLRVLNARDPTVAAFDVPLTTDGTGTTTTLKQKALGAGSVQANRYDALRIQIAEAVGAGEAARVDDAGFDGIDTLTFSPALTTVPSGIDFYLYGEGLSPYQVQAAVNYGLRTTEHPALWLPSIIDDADFAANDVTQWAAVGTPFTRVFDTTAANVLLGERALHIVADGASEGAHSNVAEVHEREHLWVSVFLYVNAGSAIVQLYDETNAAVIRAVTIDEPGFTEIRFNDTAPDGCEQVRVRFLSVAASDDFYISPHVTVQPFTARPYTAPTWLAGRRKVAEVFAIPQGYVSEDADSYVALSRRWEARGQVQWIETPRDLNLLRIIARPDDRGPLAFLAYRPFAELATPTATTNCDLDYAAWRALARYFETKGDSEQRHWLRKARLRGEALSYNLQNKRIEERLTLV